MLQYFESPFIRQQESLRKVKKLKTAWLLRLTAFLPTKMTINCFFLRSQNVV